MYTQTHFIMGAALGGRQPRFAWAGALGGIVPDVPMLLTIAVLKIAAIPDPIIFGILYWQEWWQRANAIGHNFWLWGALALCALWRRERLAVTAEAIDRWSAVTVFAASGFLHTVIDFLTHREDAHMSFWPLSRWKFISPVSYWDGAHYGHIFALFEAALGVALAVLVFRRFSAIWLRAALVLAIFLYLAVPAYFLFT
jgi:hypothetical protein